MEVKFLWHLVSNKDLKPYPYKTSLPFEWKVPHILYSFDMHVRLFVVKFSKVLQLKLVYSNTFSLNLFVIKCTYIARWNSENWFPQLSRMFYMWSILASCSYLMTSSCCYMTYSCWFPCSFWGSYTFLYEPRYIYIFHYMVSIIYGTFEIFVLL